MAGGPVDYDRIAVTYDSRYAFNRNEGVAAALRALAGERPAERVLEVGCGTGRWLAELQELAPHLCGVDASLGMLRQARGRLKGGALVAARANGLPFSRAVFDLAFCVNALHHFDDPRGFVLEAPRLLRPGGVFAVVGLDVPIPPDRWYLYQYFEGTYETDQGRFPRWESVLGWMGEAGLVEIERRVVERLYGPKVGRRVLEDPFLKKDANSQLLLLSDEAYAAGMRRIEAAVTEAEAEGRPIVFPVDLSLVMAAGRLPPSAPPTGLD